ncbi:MAG: septal ring lytic transglycosylase RlpA family protein [Pseudomonadales bacterium]|nr:septal ring lytic transglycosylase RlpA family protein [Pseudomonadales bacterium]
MRLLALLIILLPSWAQADSTDSSLLVWPWQFANEVVSPVSESSPLTEKEEGLASWYGGHFIGKRTSSGQRFMGNALTAAHRSLPLGTLVEVYAPDTDRHVIVRINDRGPHSRHRIIDLSWLAAKHLGILHAGVAKVRLRILKNRDLGPWLASSDSNSGECSSTSTTITP